MTSQTRELGEEEKQALLETFCLFDKDNNGHICAHELGMLLRAVGENPTQEQIKYFIQTCDKNKNNVIEFEDFCLLMDIIKRDSTRQEDQEKTLKRAFELFDKNKDGKIDPKELERITTQMGEKLSADELTQMFRIVDVDKDGMIDYREFIKYISKPVTTHTPMGHQKKNHTKKKH